MKLNVNDEKSIVEFIKMIEEQEGIGKSDVITFESYDYTTEKPVVINYYKQANPVKLSINVQSEVNSSNQIALYNSEGKRIEDKVEGEY